jgi:diguanylate cyclase (GGDEF)-like protein
MGLIAIVALGVVVGLLILTLLQRRKIAGLAASLADATTTDRLTGLLNRVAFEELLDAELTRSRRMSRPLSVIVGDVDGLREINARRGHHSGDMVLQLVARDMQKWKRRMDSAARIGGEEFALLLPETDERGATLLAERLRRAAHRTFADSPVPVRVSFGVASYPDHGEARGALLSAAAQALGAATRLGKDRTIVYGPEYETSELQLEAAVELAQALDIRDMGGTGHSETVGRYAELIARERGMPADQVERVRLAGILHDIGKVGVSEGILAKAGPLEPDEWQEMRTHPEIAARLLAQPEFDDVRPWIFAHHERPDGRGYPRGLAGDQIPLEARIVAVADAYEAMTAERAHRPALSAELARAELEAGAGTQFDAEVVKIFLAALARMGVATLPNAS